MKAENKIYARTIGLIPEKKEFKTYNYKYKDLTNKSSFDHLEFY